MGYWLSLIGNCDANKPVIGIGAGTVAIWDAGASGDDFTPAIAPTAYLNKVKFHNALRYKKIKKLVTSRDAGNAAVSIPALGVNNVLNQKTTLFAHGMGFRPLIIGETEIGTYKQPCSGSIIPLNNGSVTGPVPARFICITADATNVYLVVRGWYGAALTVHWKVWVFAQEFQDTDDAADLIRFTPDAVNMAALGPVDSDHRFIRKKNTGSGELRVIGKQTMAIDIQGGVNVINYSDGVKSAALKMWDNTPYPTGSLLVTGTECEIDGAPVSDAPGFYFEPPMRLVGDGGKLIFTTENAMLAGLTRYDGTITTSPHAAVASNTSNFSEDHGIGSAFGADFIFGWIKIRNSGKFLPNDEVCEFSGTVVIDGVAIYSGASFAQEIYAIIMLSPKIVGDTVILVEHGWSHSRASGPPVPGITIPAITIDYELYAGKMVGGM